MSSVDLKSLSDEQLVHHELHLEREMVTAKFQLATNQLEDSSVLKKLRRDIARARTEQRTRELANELSKDALRGRWSSTFEPGATEAASPASSGGFLQGIVDKVSGNE